MDIDDDHMLVHLTGQALNGMLANPNWMVLAKDHCDKPGQGDIPQFFGTLAARYGREALAAVKAESKTINPPRR